MPKFRVVLVKRQYQEIIFEAEDRDEADTVAYGLWDSDKPVHDLDTDVDIYDMHEVEE